MKTLVAPSLLSSDFANLQSEIKKVTAAGADWLHVDVMDGQFVKNITIGPPVVASIKKVSKIPLDVHLMIVNPEDYIAAFIKAGADIVTIHQESTKDPASVLKEVRKLGAKVGITLRPGTDIKKIESFFDLVDLVLIMTVEPGFGGQSFLTDQVDKIRYVRKHVKPNVFIEVDGGIDEKTSKICRDAGANVMVAGSYVFKNDYKAAIENLRGQK